MLFYGSSGEDQENKFDASHLGSLKATVKDPLWDGMKALVKKSIAFEIMPYSPTRLQQLAGLPPMNTGRSPPRSLADMSLARMFNLRLKASRLHR